MAAQTPQPTLATPGEDIRKSPSESTSEQSIAAATGRAESPEPPQAMSAAMPEGTTPPEGLSQSEVQRRFETYGPNALEEEKEHPLRRLLSYFWGPIPWMIEIAAILSAVVQHWADLAIILVLLLMNGLVAFWEEFQAGNAIAALKQKLAIRARVKRGGKWQMLPAREIVPGDLIRIRIGDVIPADAILPEGESILVDQSALTGESMPVERGPGDRVYSGSIIKQGEVDAQVTATGSNTYFGKTARLVQATHSESHFQRAILKIGKYLIVLAAALVSLIVVVATLRGDGLAASLQFALVLTVAAIPVAMPAVLSVTMAVGARLLAKRRAIVTRLSAIEEMAGIDILCTDKTGTLTKNQLTLGKPFVLADSAGGEADVEGSDVEVSDVEDSDVEDSDVEGSDVEGKVVLAAALASREEDADPIDLAVLGGVEDRSLLEGLEVLEFEPFDPVRKRTEALVRGPDGRRFHVTKGAPQVIIELAGASRDERRRVETAVNGFADRGYRSLGVARADDGSGWRFLGVLPLFDPPREDSRETLDAARSMGVRVKMVTGDQTAIAKETARKLGIGDRIMDADIFPEEGGQYSSHLEEEIERADGFAQVFPEHKFQIISALQRRGHITGMTGDGVNDAPALKKADAGIAVAGSTDAARAAAAIVLLDAGLSVIVDALRESRKIFQRMTSYAIYRIAETIRVLLFMTLSILVFNFYPVTAVMIVLLALLNDGPILAIARDRVRYRNEPETWKMPEVLSVSTLLGIMGVVASFGLYFLARTALGLGGEVPLLQSFMFLKLAVAGHLTIFVTRTRGPFWSIKPSALLFWTALTTKIAATLAAVYGWFMAPIGWKWALLVWVYALVWFGINDLAKLAFYRFLSRRKPAPVECRT